jgi:Right handed beta helix region
MRRVLIGTILVVVVMPAGVVAAPPNDRPVRDAADFYKAVNSAKPGDRILLAPGDYKGNFHFDNVHGTADNPIIIAAADPKHPPRFLGDVTGLSFTAVSHLELRDLILTGSKDNGLNIDDGEKPEKPTHHITLRNIHVSDVGPKGNVDGMKLSGIDDLLIVGCNVERWGSDGSGIDMVGCHRVVISRCEFRNGGDNGVQVKGGCVAVVISRCWFENAGERGVNLGGRTGEKNFRPALSTFPEDARYEVKDSRVEGCTFVGGKAAVAVIGADGATVRFNTIYHPENFAFRILQENEAKGFVPCRYGVFENNLVVFQSEKWIDGGVNVGPSTASKTFRFARNLWYCEDRPERSTPKLPVVEKDGIVGKDPILRDPAKKDFGVKADSPAATRGAHALPEEK